MKPWHLPPTETLLLRRLSESMESARWPEPNRSLAPSGTWRCYSIATALLRYGSSPAGPCNGLVLTFCTLRYLNRLNYGPSVDLPTSCHYTNVGGTTCLEDLHDLLSRKPSKFFRNRLQSCLTHESLSINQSRMIDLEIVFTWAWIGLNPISLWTILNDNFRAMKGNKNWREIVALLWRSQSLEVMRKLFFQLDGLDVSTWVYM